MKKKKSSKVYVSFFKPYTPAISVEEIIDAILDHTAYELENWGEKPTKKQMNKTKNLASAVKMLKLSLS